ncbi:PEPxxWA-CTERM sorting domain-containing protein [Sphingomonas sp. DT-51]|uniref:PEPxxWA-CTERM sorting domain-containing protein n=1 Tax=Sphingomonas sp. DT-51 TaxID=3396165 RepID=UPI003F53FBB4
MAAAVIFGTPAQAATVISLTVDGTYTGRRDFVSGTVETFAPRAFTIVATLPLPAVTDPPGSTPPEVYTDYDATQLGIATPFVAEVGPDPIGNGLADLPGQAYAQAIVQTFGHDGYSSQFTLSQNLDHSDNVNGWAYSVRLSLCCDTPASLRDSDLSMTPSRLTDFLALQVGKPVDFSTGWYGYRYVKDGDFYRTDYTAGSGPTGIKAVLTSFNLISSVPEPATWTMMILGFAMTGVAMRGARRRKTA